MTFHFKRMLSIGLVLTLVVSSVALAQRGRWSRYDNDGRMSDRRGVPTWETNENFPSDLFTFVRIRYDSYGGRRGGWATDYPDADLNFSLRLQQLTTLKVNPDPIVLDLTDDRLFDYPFIYIVEPGQLVFSSAEREALRRYCFNGGFVMIDDFWGDDEYENLRRELADVFPDRSPIDVPLEHEIFQCVYPFSEKPQVPAAGNGYIDSSGQLVTWDPPRRRRDDTRTVNYRAIYDDEGRIMIFICHNTDLGDGWEREGENQWYFEEFSVKRAYPMGINIVTYAMTH